MFFASSRRSTRPVLAISKTHGDEYPAQGILDDRRCDHQLTQIAASEVHLVHHHRHDLDRRNGKRHAQKQRSRQPALRIGQELGGNQETQRHAAQKRHDDAQR